MKKYTFIIITFLITITVTLLLLLRHQPTQPTAPSSPPVAKVNNTQIPQDLLKKRQSQREYFYTWLKENNATSSSIPDNLLNQLIEESLTYQFAESNNLLPTKKEIEQMYQKAVQSTNQSEDEYLKKIAQIQSRSKQDVLDQIRLELTQSNIVKFTNIPYHVWIKTEVANADIQKYE